MLPIRTQMSSSKNSPPVDDDNNSHQLAVISGIQTPDLADNYCPPAIEILHIISLTAQGLPAIMSPILNGPSKSQVVHIYLNQAQ